MKRLIALVLLVAPLFLSGCVLDTILGDVVNKSPTAVIDASPVEGTAPLTVGLDAHYSHDDDGEIVLIQWDYGDPTSAQGLGSSSACEHTYTYPGTYLIKLTVTDDEGSMGTQQIAVVVTNPPPTAVASVSDASPYPGDAVTFSADGSYDYNGEIVSYTWSFGDGDSGEGETTTHSYIEGGTYTVTLTVTDDEGATGSTKLTVSVLPGTSNCSGDTCGSDNNVAVSFESSPSVGSSCSTVPAGKSITFIAHVNSEDPIIIKTYSWDFGDGGAADGKTVTYAYPKSGVYTLKLSVADTDGNVYSTIGTPVYIGSSSTCY